jgi:hypothetical protein
MQRGVLLRGRNRMHAKGSQRGRTRAMLPKTHFPNKRLGDRDAVVRVRGGALVDADTVDERDQRLGSKQVG